MWEGTSLADDFGVKNFIYEHKSKLLYRKTMQYFCCHIH